MKILNIIVVFLSLCANAKTLKHLPISNSGWLGADGAHSVVIDTTKRFWVFNDTFVGKISKDKRVDGNIIKNSVAIEVNGKFKYSFGRNKTPFFKNERDNEWYWPSDLIKIKNKIYVFLKRVKKTRENDPFGFTYLGTDLGIINMSSEEPSFWKVDFFPITLLKKSVVVAVEVFEKNIFLLYENNNSDHSLYLAKILKKDLINKYIKINFFNKDINKWGKNAEKKGALFSVGSPEASLRFLKNKKRWRVVFSPKGMSEKIVSLSASSIYGPWSDPKIVHSCLEHSWNKNYYCYSAKEIPSTHFQISYNVNSTDFWDISKDPKIYIPRLINLD